MHGLKQATQAQLPIFRGEAKLAAEIRNPSRGDCQVNTRTLQPATLLGRRSHDMQILFAIQLKLPLYFNTNDNRARYSTVL